jgi:cell division protease FtsH
VNGNNRNIFIWVGVLLTLVLLFNSFNAAQQKAGSDSALLAYSDFMNAVEDGGVSDVTIKGQNIKGHYTEGGAEFKTRIPEGENVVDRIGANDVRIVAEPGSDEEFSLFGILISWFPMLLLIGVWIFFMRQMQGKGGGGGAMGFGKSRARMLNEDKNRVTFDDVAGVEEAKTELEEIVEFLKDPQKFQRLGGRIPKGALLVGTPGTGKTLIARAVAGEAEVPFFTISGSDFVEMFVGVGASRVRDMFEQGKKNAPCIIFIDEIDAVGRHRGAGYGGGNDEREQTLNQLLVEMDGFEASEGVIIIAATNRPDVLDPALLRPGRFDRQVTIPNPDVNGREAILQVHMKKVPLAKNVDAHTIARGTPGFSGAELANLVNEAALLAARRNKRVVGMEELEEAKDKVMMGAERRSMAMNEDEKKLTAYHEAGHALVAVHEPESDPIHKATIVPRGQALGMVMRLPEGDRYSYSLAKMRANLSVAMGGRVAEEIIFGKEYVTNGASGDIQQATSMATSMVTQWGLSEKIGLIDYSDSETEYRQKRISSQTSADIENEIRRFVDEGYKKAHKILTDNLDKLHLLGEALLEYEMLTGDEIKELLEKGVIIRETPKDRNDGGTPSASVPKAGKVKIGKAKPKGT